MKKLLVLSFFILAFVLAFPKDATLQTKSQIETDELRTASAKAIQRIQYSQKVWYKKQVCTSCHHQLLPEITLKMARDRGVQLDETVAKKMTTEAFAGLKDLDAVVQGYDYIDVLFDAYALTSASVAGIKPNLSTDAYAQFIASSQHADGSWQTFDARPPQSHSLFTTTAVCAKAIRYYLPAQLKKERAARLGQARAWLMKTQPRTTEDRAFQLLGLHWTDADLNTRQKLAKQLLSEQRKDGGWAQLSTLSSDAYATGEVLFALHEGGGLPTNDAAYQRGLKFLLASQRPDGAWFVKSRLNPPAPVSPRYVDTEFPEGHDQFISIMGTSWAVNALLQALPAQAAKPAQIDLAPAEKDEWISVALSGSAAELKKLLDAGLNPNSKTAQGTSLLMLAARDAEKVKLLLERGADVNARAQTGITALMIAARYRGNSETIRLLLAKGAQPNADAKVRNDASALVFSVMAGDVKTAEMLVAAGAKVQAPMKLLGQFMNTPLLIATGFDDAAMAEFLISKGADPNEGDTENMTPLIWAVLANHAETAQVLIAHGAKVNHVDNLGMTPLLYAASIDFGDTAVLEKLLAAGADVKFKNKQGQTAFDLAKGYNYAKAAGLLSARIASR